MIAPKLKLLIPLVNPDPSFILFKTCCGPLIIVPQPLKPFFLNKIIFILENTSINSINTESHSRFRKSQKHLVNPCLERYRPLDVNIVDLIFSCDVHDSIFDLLLQKRC